MDKKNVIDFCHECKFAWSDGCPKGQWPCVNCSQNFLWQGYKTDYMVEHFVKKDIFYAKGDNIDDYSFYWGGN